LRIAGKNDFPQNQKHAAMTSEQPKESKKVFLS
jgi:hypothetical protein